MSNHHSAHRHHLDHYRRHHRHRRLKQHTLRVLPILILLGLILGTVHYHQQLAIWYYQLSKPAIPTAVVAPQVTTPTPLPNSASKSTSSTIKPIPAELNLSVPFTSQAPTGNWDAAHEEYCEEASALMVARYFQHQSIGTADETEQTLASLANWEKQHFGYFESTTAAETKQMIEANSPLKVTLETDVSTNTIKQALANNQLVIAPSAGRKLGNPYFTSPGPIYHMLVIKGYTKDGKFITNDPGTRHGADYIYDEQVLLNAIGDYNHNDPVNGQKVILIVSQN